jgi:hypothetical protein
VSAGSSWDSILSSDKMRISRKILVEKCNFPRSTIYQNKGVVEKISALEAQLFEDGIIKCPLIDVEIFKDDNIVHESLSLRSEEIEKNISALDLMFSEVVKEIKRLDDESTSS